MLLFSTEVSFDHPDQSPVEPLSLTIAPWVARTCAQLAHFKQLAKFSENPALIIPTLVAKDGESGAPVLIVPIGALGFLLVGLSAAQTSHDLVCR